jgi:hypothetical protein
MDLWCELWGKADGLGELWYRLYSLRAPWSEVSAYAAFCQGGLVDWWWARWALVHMWS